MKSMLFSNLLCFLKNALAFHARLTLNATSTTPSLASLVVIKWYEIDVKVSRSDTHTHTHTHNSTHKHNNNTPTHKHTQTHTHTHKHTQTHTNTHTNTHTHSHTLTHTHKHLQSQKNTQTPNHTQTQIHTFTKTHTLLEMYIIAIFSFPVPVVGFQPLTLGLLVECSTTFPLEDNHHPPIHSQAYSRSKSL